MARTAPIPNIPAIPGMNPGMWIMAGGGSGGGTGGKNAKGAAGDQSATGNNGGNAPTGGGKNATACGPGGGGGCPNPVHGNPGLHAGDPIDLATGRVYTTEVVDLALPGPLPLTIARSYSSDAVEEDVGLGAGWSHSLAWTIEERRVTLRVHEPAAAPTAAPKPEENGSVLLPCGKLHRLAWGYVLEAGATTYYFAERRGDVYALSRIADRRGNTIGLVYQGGRLEQIVDSVGRTVRVRRNEGGRIAAFEVKNASEQGRWVSFRSYTYDEAGDLIAARDAAGQAMRYAYDDAHRLIRRSAPGGLVAEFRYDRQGRGVETWCHRAGNDALDEGLPEVLADGVTPAKGFLHVKLDHGDDGAEVITSRTVRRAHANALQKAEKIVFAGGVSTYAYDGAGNATGYADALGAVTRFDRDDEGRLLATVDPVGARIEYRYDDRGFVAEVVNALGESTRFERDAAGEVTSIDDREGNVVHLVYDARGHIVEGVLPDGGITRMTYDPLGNRVEVVEPDGSARRIRYDFLGRVLSFTDERGGTTSYAYDDCGRVLSVRSPSGAATSYGHDVDGNLSRITDPDGRVTQLRWGGFNVVTEVVRPDGHAVRYRYDREQELVRVVNEQGEEHRLVRSSEGRVVAERTFDGRSVAYRYDALGQITRIQRDLTATEFLYDAAGRLVERKHEDGSGEKFTYDLAGRMIGAENAEVSCEYTYDARGNIVRERVAHEGHVVVHEKSLDALGRVVKQLGPAGAVEVRRDRMGRAVEVSYGDAAPLLLRYDAAGQEAERLLPGGGRVTHELSGDGLLSRVVVAAPGRSGAPAGAPAWVGKTPLDTTLARALTWSAGARLAQVDDLVGGVQTSLRRDANGRAVERRHGAHVDDYGYSASGDLFEPSAPRRYEGGGRPVARGDTEYVYDRDGRVIEKRTAGPTPALWTFDWREDGLLGGVHTPDGGHVTFAYDAFARRVLKRVERAGERRVTRYAWDGDLLVQEVEQAARASGDPVVEERSYVFVPGRGLPVAQRRVRDGEAGAFEHYVHAPNGFPDALVRGDGSVVGEIDASLYGAVAGDAAALTPVRAPGQFADDEIGLFYNRHRFYDPASGTYLSPEPLGLAVSLKPYAYVDNFPGEWVDPLGLAPAQGVVTRNDGSTVSALSGQAQGNAKPDYRPGDPMAAQQLHPAVVAALPPDPNNARTPGSGGAPSACAEPLALSRHLYDWEKRNKPARCNPPDKDWQKNLQGALGEVSSIHSKEDKGAGGPKAACPNCGQTIPRLWALAGMSPPNGIFKGGVENPTNPAWRPSDNHGQNSKSPVVFNDPKTGTPIQPGAFTNSGGTWTPAP
jgi:RHS repeat-associated protein